MYFSTFITGLSSVVELQLNESVKDVSVKSLQDGLIIYSTDTPQDQIAKLPFFNNTFLLIKTFKDVDVNTKSINKIMKQTIEDKNVFYHLNKKIPESTNSFRVVISVGNKMVGPDKNILYRLEDKIIEKLNLQVSKSLPDIELWYFIRREGGTAYFGIRITKHTEYRKILEKGELHPELCNILCYISNPSSNDVFLDPFTGSGAIPIQIFSSFEYKKIIIGDIDTLVIKKLKNKLENLGGNFIDVEVLDALNLDKIKNESIDKIITDPPWGINVGIDIDLNDFYRKMLLEFYRVLSKIGSIVILVGKKDLFEDILSELKSQFSINSRYDILVSGQKAGLYKLDKINI